MIQSTNIYSKTQIKSNNIHNRLQKSRTNNNIKKNYKLIMQDVETFNVPMSPIFVWEIMNYQSKLVIQVEKECIQVVNTFIRENIDF